MEALLLHSFPFAPSRLARACEKRFRRKKSCSTSRSLFVVHCQGQGGGGGGGGGNAIKTSSAGIGFSSILTASTSTDLVDKGSLVLSPNGKNISHENNNIAVKDLVPFGGSSQSTSSLEMLDNGIGILHFLRGKSFFITGATGFLAKVLIEKILRTVPDVGKIFLLIKAKNKEAAMGRLKNEIINTELFKRLQQTYGKSYQAFMLSKLVPVVGNVCESDLGVDGDLAETIAKEVDVIVNSAANTTFDERYDVALSINTKGPCNLMNFSKKCKKLKLFLQVSTAYVNGQRQGRIMEKPFGIGESIAKEKFVSETPRELLPTLDVENEMKLALTSKEAFDNNAMAQKMKELGLERCQIFLPIPISDTWTDVTIRAQKYGWQDTYVFTKAMGEMMVDSMRGDVPVVPADMVVNATLAAMAKHGLAQKPGINVYQIASSVVNPLVFQDLARLLYEHYNSSPCVDPNGKPIHVPSMKLFRSMDDFSEHIWRDTAQRNGLAAMAASNAKLSQKLEIICRKSVEQAKHLANIYEPYTFYGGRFDNSNTQRLMENMSEEEKRKFGFDVESINWSDYIINVHIPGLRRHVMKGRGMPS
ncbi:hypothetical protein TIFTF001_025080 [Ficus carica]|uniref:Fatty acyl-CoA reductase n=1 Tax=Ficus carica TaxID=3494 RepID=A0AA88DGF1_FICCA|nr:hypothetical protein TIFTF001_025080 [Ficus carica]